MIYGGMAVTQEKKDGAGIGFKLLAVVFLLAMCGEIIRKHMTGLKKRPGAGTDRRWQVKDTRWQGKADEKVGHDRLRCFYDSPKDLYEDNPDDYEDEDEAWDEWYND